MNILITGYSSTIGTSLIRKLLESGHTCFAFGRKPLNGFPNTKWISWTLGQKLDLTDLPNIDVVMHLAWQTTSRRESFHLNVGGSIQLLEQFSGGGARVIFVSSLAALNPMSDYGLAKSEVEKHCLTKRIEIVRPGLILNAEQHTEKFRKLHVIPAAKTPVYVTHLDCLISELLASVLNEGLLDRNVVCRVTALSDLMAQNSYYLPFPGIVARIFLIIASKLNKLNDMRDAFISLMSTPELQPTKCLHELKAEPRL